MRWSDWAVTSRHERHPPFLIGVLPGEGVGPDVTGAALHVLDAVASACDLAFTVECGGAIGRDAERECGQALSPEVVTFCRSVFDRGGAVLAGAGGGRFVYDLRRVFDLYCKISPVRVSSALLDAVRLRPEHARGVDLLIVRENMSGIYQGTWSLRNGIPHERTAEHTFHYREPEVHRILRVGAGLAQQRRGLLTVIYKDAGVPSISALWREVAGEVAAQANVELEMLDVDHAAFRLIQHARLHDVIVAPNLFGDILGDLAAVLLGSRGLSFSGNFSADGAAVYQTNHGAAYDLRGLDRANPVGQILSLAMLLRESFGLMHAAHLVEVAVEQVWREGWRTADLVPDGRSATGTRALAGRVADAVTNLHRALPADETAAVAR